MSTLIKKPNSKIAPELLRELQALTYEQGQVVVHCLYRSVFGGDLIRIWPTTFLFDCGSDHVSELVTAEKISMYPQWTQVHQGEFYFTLIFTGLPKSCNVFDIIEDCNGSSGAFKVLGITRTTNDVYYVQL